MVADSVRFVAERGREAVYDAEHFFDGYHGGPRLRAVHAPGRPRGRRPDARPVRHERRHADRRAGPDPRRRPGLARGRPRRARGRVGHPHPQRRGARGRELDRGGPGGRPPRPGDDQRLRRALRQREHGLDPRQPRAQDRARPDAVGRRRPLAASPSSSRSVAEIANRRPTTTSRTSAGRRSPTRAASTARRWPRSSAATSTSTRSRSATSAGSSCRSSAGSANTAIRARQLGHELEGSSTRASCRNLIKRLEHEGLAFEGAEASFELLIRRRLAGLRGPVPDRRLHLPRGAAVRAASSSPRRPSRSRSRARSSTRPPTGTARSTRSTGRCARRSGRSIRSSTACTSSTTRSASWTGRPRRLRARASSSTRRTARHLEHDGQRHEHHRGVRAGARGLARVRDLEGRRRGPAARRAALHPSNGRPPGPPGEGRQTEVTVVSGEPIRLDRWTVTSGSNAVSRAAVVLHAGSHDWKASADGQRGRSTRCSGPSTRRSRRSSAAARGSSPTTSMPWARAPTPRAGSPSGSRRRPAPRVAGPTACSTRDVVVQEHDRGLGGGVRRGAQRDARDGRLGGCGRGRRLRAPAAPGCRAPARPRRDGVRRGGPVDRHHRVVQPLGGAARRRDPPRGPSTPTPSTGSRRPAGRQRAGSYGVPVADDAAGRRDGARARRRWDPAGRCSTWARARATSPRPPQRSGRTPWASTSRRRWSGGRRSPTPSIPFRLGSFEAIPGGGRGVRRGRRQLRVQPRRAAGDGARGVAAGPAVRGLARAVDVGRRRTGTGCSGSCSTPSRRPTRRPRPACRDGPTNFRTDAELRELFERAGFDGRSACRTSSSRPRSRPRTSCGTASSTRRSGSRRSSPQQASEIQARIRDAFDRLVRGPSPGRRVARDPGRGPGDARAATVSRPGPSRAAAGRLHRRARRLRGGGRPALLRGSRARAVSPRSVPCSRGCATGRSDAGVVPVESVAPGDDPREPRPPVGVRPAGRRRGVRPGAARAARAAGGAARDRGARLLDRRGARPGGRLPAVPTVDDRDVVQHGRRGAAGGRARGAGRGGGRIGEGRGDLRPRGARRRHPVGLRQPHAVRGRGPARRRGERSSRRPRRRRGGRAADIARVRRPERRRGRCTGRSVRSRPAGSTSSRLESRPWTERGARWEYLFWVDLDADPADPACAEALAALGEETEVVRILGTYPRAPED